MCLYVASKARKTVTQKVFNPKYRVVEHARNILSDPKKWVRVGAFTDTHGNKTRINDPSTSRFCAIGAVERAVTDLYGSIHEDPSAYRVFCAVREDLDKFAMRNFWPHHGIVDLNASDEYPDPRLCFIEICDRWLKRNR